MSRFKLVVCAFRLAAWLCFGLIAVLSLIPHHLEVRTGLPAFVEHMLAYAATGGLFGAGYLSWAWWQIASAMLVYAGCLEVLQALVPGRHPGFDGAFASGAGALLGALVAKLAVGSRLQP